MRLLKPPGTLKHTTTNGTSTCKQLRCKCHIKSFPLVLSRCKKLHMQNLLQSLHGRVVFQTHWSELSLLPLMPLPTTLSGTSVYQMWHFIHKVTQHSNVPESIYVLQALHVALDFLEMSPARNWEVQLTQVMLPLLHLPQRHQPCHHFHHSPSNGQRGRWWCSPRFAPAQRFATSLHAKPSSPTNDQNDVHILKNLHTGESDWLGEVVGCLFLLEIKWND